MVVVQCATNDRWGGVVWMSLVSLATKKSRRRDFGAESKCIFEENLARIKIQIKNDKLSEI